MLEGLRIATSVIWFVLLVLGWPFFWRAVHVADGLRPLDGVVGSMWVLSVNREAFAAVAEWDPGDPDALIMCYALALIGGLMMTGAILWARRDPR